MQLAKFKHSNIAVTTYSITHTHHQSGFSTLLNLLAPELFFNFSTHYIQNVNNTGTKQVRIMKQTAF